MPKNITGTNVYADNALNRRLNRVGQPMSPEGFDDKESREAFQEVRSKNEKALYSLSAGESHEMKSKDEKIYRATRSLDGNTISFYLVDESTKAIRKVKQIDFKKKK
jgi:hypothetical protein